MGEGEQGVVALWKGAVGNGGIGEALAYAYASPVSHETWISPFKDTFTPCTPPPFTWTLTSPDSYGHTQQFIM